MQRHIVCFDTETTGLDVQRDWIIQLSLVKVDARTFEEVGVRNWYIRPSGTYTIAPEAQAVHHITREQLEADGVALRDVYPDMMAFLQGCDILSYNGNNFDARILYYNLLREGLPWELGNSRFYDAYIIETARTSRRLGDVYRRYYGHDFEDAHNSLADVRATIAVFKAQRETSQSEQEFLRPEFDFVSVDGFLAAAPSKDSEGNIVPVFAQGKHRGKTLAQVQQQDPTYLDWVMKNCAAPTRQLIEDARRGDAAPHVPPQKPACLPEQQEEPAPAPKSKPSPRTQTGAPIQASLFDDAF